MRVVTRTMQIGVGTWGSKSLGPLLVYLCGCAPALEVQEIHVESQVRCTIGPSRLPRETPCRLSPLRSPVVDAQVRQLLHEHSRHLLRTEYMDAHASIRDTHTHTHTP